MTTPEGSEKAAPRSVLVAGRIRWMLLASILIVIAFVAKRTPVWEWDLLAYAACVEELSGGTPAQVHQEVYLGLVRAAPADALERLCTGNEYRAAMGSEPDAFASQLPFYRGRVLYVGALALLGVFGVPPIPGAFLLSFLSGVAVALVLALWILRLPWPALCGYLGILWLVAIGWSDTLATATPDAFAAALILGGAFLLLQTRHLWPALVVLGLALAVRVDHVFLVGLLLLLRYLHPVEGRELGLRVLLPTLAVYAGVVLLCTVGRGTYGWWIVFHHTFVEYKTDPVAQTPPLDVAFWLKRTASSLPMFKAWQPLLTTLVGLAAVGIGFRKLRWESPGAGLAAVALLGVGIHFLLFPALWPRLFLAHWVLIGVAAVTALGERRGEPA